MSDDIDNVYHRKDGECPPALHDLLPIIEHDRTVGVVCIICGKSVREDRSVSDQMVTSLGLSPQRYRRGTI